MKYLIFMSVVFVATAVANAEVYEWTDKSGVVNFTDNMDKIPSAYRDKAREIDVSPSIQNSEVAAEPANPAAPAAKSSFGGHDEFWWRSSFKSLRTELKYLQDSLLGKKEDLNNLRRRWVISMGRTPKSGESSSIDNLTTKSALSTPGQHREAYYQKKAEIEGDEAKIIELQKRLDQLDDDAARAGVPLEWRKQK